MIAARASTTVAIAVVISAQFGSISTPIGSSRLPGQPGPTATAEQHTTASCARTASSWRAGRTAIGASCARALRSGLRLSCLALWDITRSVVEDVGAVFRGKPVACHRIAAGRRGIRCVGSVGNAPRHPVGAKLHVGSFPRKKWRCNAQFSVSTGWLSGLGRNVFALTGPSRHSPWSHIPATDVIGNFMRWPISYDVRL